MEALLRIRNLSHHYGRYQALSDFSVDFGSSQIIGLLGPNGAGKTTLIRCITQIIAADSGEILFKNRALTEADRLQFGYMPEERGLYKKMKVGEHLLYLAQLKGLSVRDATQRIKDYLKRLEAEDWWNKKVEDLSKGMQQKIQFIATVLHQPEFIILDEPFSGLDPINARLIESEIHRLKNEGATILFSTHRMEQVEDLCESIVLINQGKKLLDGRVKELQQQFREQLYEVEWPAEQSLPSSFPYAIERKEGYRNIFRLRDNENSNALLQSLLQVGIHIQSFRELLPSIGEIFIRSVKESNHPQAV